MNNCELCSFRNPKSCVTAVIIRGNKLLVLKRNEDPYKGSWDLPGGYVSEGETPEAAMLREVQEELSVRPRSMVPMKLLPGIAYWKEESFPVTGHFFLVDIADQDIRLNEENSAYEWLDLSTIDPESIAFDSNQAIVRWLKEDFTFDFERVRILVKQLDHSAEIDEQSLYRAIIEGKLVTEYADGKLVGMGWAFPRQTMLRRQAVIEDMIVDDAYRGRGLGKKIMLALIEWAKQSGIEVLELTTGHHRVAAGKLYESVGFKLHETRHMLMKL